MIEITHAIARKVLNTVDAGLVSGVGKRKLGQMCVEEAVCFALGEPHGDEPTCVAPALRAFKIGLNDALWSTPQARASGLRRLALVQLGTADAFDATDFARRLAMMTINRVIPRVLRIAAAMKLPPQNSQGLEEAETKCEVAIGLSAASYAASAAGDAARAARAASDAASAAASYAAGDAASAASYAASDKELATTAEDVVQILIAMNVPGVQWLDMAPLAD